MDDAFRMAGEEFVQLLEIFLVTEYNLPGPIECRKEFREIYLEELGIRLVFVEFLRK